MASSKSDFLARALGRAGATSDPEAAIRDGRVRLNGKIVKQPLTSLRQGDRVQLDGKAVNLEAPTLALMLHKPPGCVTTAKDPEGRRTVFDVLVGQLPDDLREYKWHAIGRLDIDTTGLLLFTNDESLVELVTTSRVGRRYLATVSGKPKGDRLEKIGARLRGPGLVELTLTQGRFHEAKRVLGSIGLPVLQLHREAIGSVELDIPSGAFRPLKPGEIAALGQARSKSKSSDF